MLTCEESVEALFEDFRGKQSRELRFGAGDTEPDWVWQDHVARSLGLRKGAARLPQGADEWEVYSTMPGAEDAAFRLSCALQELTQGLRQLLADDPPTVLEAVRGKLWRLNL